MLFIWSQERGMQQEFSGCAWQRMPSVGIFQKHDREHGLEALAHPRKPLACFQPVPSLCRAAVAGKRQKTSKQKKKKKPQKHKKQA